MAQYLRSQTTGVVLPYNEKLLRRDNVELMTPEECSAYEASVKKPEAVAVVAAEPPPPPPTPAVETLPDEDEVVVEQPEVVVADATAEELLASLEGD